MIPIVLVRVFPSERNVRRLWVGRSFCAHVVGGQRQYGAHPGRSSWHRPQRGVQPLRQISGFRRRRPARQSVGRVYVVGDSRLPRSRRHCLRSQLAVGRFARLLRRRWRYPRLEHATTRDKRVRRLDIEPRVRQLYSTEQVENSPSNRHWPIKARLYCCHFRLGLVIYQL